MQCTLPVRLNGQPGTRCQVYKPGERGVYVRAVTDLDSTLRPQCGHGKCHCNTVIAVTVDAATVNGTALYYHDAVLAATSHLPHVLAYALVDSLARLQDNQEIFDYAAGGFRDFTRIASSDPHMWRDICLSNSAAVHTMIERFIVDLQALAVAVRDHDGDRLLEIFSSAKAARDRFVE